MVAETISSNNYLRLSAEVRDALASHQPVVALESTVIAHGLPWPANRDVALAMEAMVRAEGAIPATVAVLDGAICVGLSASQIERLATEPGVLKASRRDLAVALAQGLTAATTVAGTLACAALAGIRVFATGGIGGVHRGAEQTLDISADLPEIARSTVLTVCAGAKAILDLPRTLEYLETLSVPVIGYETDVLPAFYSRLSNLRVPHRADSPQQVAAIAAAQWQSGVGGGLLLACPVPAENEIAAETIERAIETAVDDATRQHIVGPALTPFLLSRLAELTGGTSVETNRALLINNARIGARCAVALSEGGGNW